MPLLLFALSPFLRSGSSSLSDLLSAANSGNATAAYRYSQSCPDPSLSSKYLQMAIDASIPEALFAFARSLETLGNHTFASLYHRAMALGSLDGQYRYARCLWLGTGGAATDRAEAIYLWRDGADRGHSASQIEIGHIFATGDYIPENLTATVYYFNLSSKQGDPDGKVLLAQMLAQGIGIPENRLEAARLYKEAADLGSAEGQFRFGFALLLGLGVTQNVNRSAHYLRLAAEQNYSEAQFLYATLLADGRGVRRDLTESARLFEASARAGFARAQVAYAKLLLRGDVVARNASAASKWLQAAVAQGSADAHVELAALFRRGLGVSKNESASTELLRIAAGRGHGPAMAEFGMILLRSHDVEGAMAHCEPAASRGYAPAAFCAGRAAEEKGEFAEAAGWFGRAAERGSQEAQAALGALIVRGKGVEKNVTAGMEMLLGGQERGCVEALLRLAEIAEEGAAGEVDLGRAFGLLEEAVKVVEEKEVEDGRPVERRDALLERNAAAVREIAVKVGGKSASKEVARMIERAREKGIVADGQEL
jgi:TPR repeat protein